MPSSASCSRKSGCCRTSRRQSEKLLPLVLVGQPELADRLNLPSLRQLKQRVALRCELGTLNAAETAAYVAGPRDALPAARPSTSSPASAVAEIHQRSGGVPRTISVICDNALVNGFALGIKPITADLIREVCARLRPGQAASRLRAHGGRAAGCDAPRQP